MAGVSDSSAQAPRVRVTAAVKTMESCWFMVIPLRAGLFGSVTNQCGPTSMAQQLRHFTKYLCENAKAVADIDQMLVFARVVARGSFSAAARELGVPPSTVSRKVTALEDRLGSRLLERTTRRLNLTEAGALYFERCRQIAGLVAEADAAIEELMGEPRGLLRIAAPPGWGQGFLAAPLASLVKRYPGVRVQVVLSERASDLIDEGFELAIRVTTQINDPSLIVRRLGTSTPVLCASPAYIEANGGPRSIEALADYAIIGLGRTQVQFAWRFVDSHGRVIAVPLEPTVQVNSAMLAHTMCRAGVGIALIPSFLADPDIASGALVALLPELEPRSFEVFVVFSRGVQRMAKVRAVIDVLYEHFGKHPSWR
ncbi:MAG: LysR family transcriptional regulator [Myxococcota bacterium]